MSATIHVTLDDEQKAWLDEQVAKGRFPDAATGLRVLLERMRQSSEEDLLEDFLGNPVNEEERRQALARLEKLLDEGVASGPPIPLTPQVWAEIHQEVERRLRQREAG